MRVIRLSWTEFTAKEFSSELARTYFATGCICKLPGMMDVKVNVSNHFMADAINKQVNESTHPSLPPNLFLICLEVCNLL